MKILDICLIITIDHSTITKQLYHGLRCDFPTFSEV